MKLCILLGCAWYWLLLTAHLLDAIAAESVAGTTTDEADKTSYRIFFLIGSEFIIRCDGFLIESRFHSFWYQTVGSGVRPVGSETVNVTATATITTAPALPPIADVWFVVLVNLIQALIAGII